MRRVLAPRAMLGALLLPVSAALGQVAVPAAPVPLVSVSLPVAPAASAAPIRGSAAAALGAPLASLLPSSLISVAADPAPLRPAPAAPSATLRAIGGAIQGSRNLEQARRNLERLGVRLQGTAGKADTKEGSPETLAARLETLWYDAAPHTPRAFELDRLWPVPAVVARAGGVTYRIHGLFPHPATLSMVPPQSGSVRRLVEALRERGAALYSEQNLPAAYAYGYGQETVDFDPVSRAPLAQASLRPAKGTPSPVLNGPAKAAWSAVSAGVPLAVALFHGLGPWGWPLFAAAVAYQYLFWTAWIPLRRARELLKARALVEAGDVEQGRALARWARAVLTTRPDPDAFRRVKLPLPESEYRATRYGHRARAMAAALAEDAKRRGLSEVHILTGANHMEELAWQLAGN